MLEKICCCFQNCWRRRDSEPVTIDPSPSAFNSESYVDQNFYGIPREAPSISSHQDSFLNSYKQDGSIVSVLHNKTITESRKSFFSQKKSYVNSGGTSVSNAFSLNSDYHNKSIKASNNSNKMISTISNLSEFRSIEEDNIDLLGSNIDETV